MARAWYTYDTVGNPLSPTSYRLITSKPGCVNGPIICSIYATKGNAFPILSANILQYIANGLANNIAEPAIPVGSKFYVYLKGLTV